MNRVLKTRKSKLESVCTSLDVVNKLEDIQKWILINKPEAFQHLVEIKKMVHEERENKKKDMTDWMIKRE